jgi:hypothetical protein
MQILNSNKIIIQLLVEKAGRTNEKHRKLERVAANNSNSNLAQAVCGTAALRPGWPVLALLMLEKKITDKQTS